MKKELWIQIFSYKPSSDAAANRAFSFAKHFNKNGFKVHVITNGINNNIEIVDDIEIYRIANKFHYKKKSVLNRFLDNLVFLNGSKKVILKNKLDIDKSFYFVSSPELISSKAAILAKKCGAKLIFDVRDIWPEVAIQMGAFSEKSFFAKHFKKCAIKMYEECDCLTTVGQRKYQYLKEYNKGKYSNKTRLVSNGVDLDDLKIEFDYSIVKKYNLDNKKYVSYVGNVGAAQGLETMLEIAKNHSDLLFIICGKGKELIKLQDIVYQNNISNVMFTGEITKSQALAIIEMSYISFISLQSKLMIDSVPTKLYESLALGVPTFLIASGESCDILNETGLGKAATPGDEKEILSNFNYMLENYSCFKPYIDSTIELVKNKYSRQSANKELECIFDEMFYSDHI
ncbi:MAG: glycosyltransferase family 4 protein [Bacilli bacterium]|nr:glycosyltransferase family 4 protein [Bacilli bacterium]